MRTLLILFLFFGMIGCKTKYVSTTTKERNLETNIHHSSEVVTLPTRYVSISNCPDLDQLIELGGTTVDLQAIGDSIRVVIESEERISRVDTIYKDRFVEKIVTEKEEVIIKKTPKWNWYIMGVLLAIALWAYRGTIWKFIRKLIVPV